MRKHCLFLFLFTAFSFLGFSLLRVQPLKANYTFANRYDCFTVYCCANRSINFMLPDNKTVKRATVGDSDGAMVEERKHFVHVRILVKGFESDFTIITNDNRIYSFTIVDYQKAGAGYINNNVIISDPNANFVLDMNKESAKKPGSAVQFQDESEDDITTLKQKEKYLNCLYRVKKKKGKSFLIDKVCDNKVITTIHMPLNRNRPAIFYSEKKRSKNPIPCVYYDKGDVLEIHRVLASGERFILENGNNITHIFRKK